MLKQGTRVLVTGGAGFIGSHVARALVAAGCQVRVLDDLSSGKRERLNGLGPKLELLHADVRNPTAVERAAAGANVVVHLAASPVGADPSRAQEVLLGGALNLLNAARNAERNERPRVILCGSGSVYGKQSAFVLHEELAPRPSLPEAVMALATEQYGRVYREAYGVTVSNLRIFRTFGPDEDADRGDCSVVAKFIRAALDGTSPVIHGDGQQTRDLIYVDNVVAAILAACEPGCDHPDPLNVASGEAVAINFLWNVILELTGKKRLAIEPTYVPAAPWDPKHARPQIQRSCKLLGWAPSVRLRDGLGRTVQHYLSMRNADPNAWFAPREDSGPISIPKRPRTLPPPMPTETSQANPLRRSGSLVTPPPLPPSLSSVAQRPTRPAPPPPPSGVSGVRKTPSPVQTAPVISVGHPEPEVEETRIDEELNFEWAPVPAVPGMGR